MTWNKYNYKKKKEMKRVNKYILIIKWNYIYYYK